MEISKATPLRLILRVRPLAVQVLEEAAGHHCWACLDQNLQDFCRDRGLEASGLEEAISALAPVPADSDWKAKPIYYLIDYLTANHRRFREKDLPALGRLLDVHGVPTFPDRYAFELMSQEFLAFEQELLKHMQEEEEFLFPKIMRNEACFRYREMTPEPYRGSVNLFLTLQPHKQEEEIKHMFMGIREKLRNLRVQEGTRALLDKANAALEAFQVALVTHADLETQVLFPVAGRLEQELYENSAPGMFRFPGDQ